MRTGFKNTSIRGFLANVKTKPPLILGFQWNPTDVKESKTAKYSEIEVGGYHAPIQVFSSGGAHSYKFSLLFDSTIDTIYLNIFRIDIPLAGIYPAVMALQSFLYPQTKGFSDLIEVGFGEPPICYFGMGVRVVKGYVKSLAFDYQLYDRLLTPQRVKCDVEFQECEDGVQSKVNAMFRRSMSLLQLGRNL
jgi:hypothetical protein